MTQRPIRAILFDKDGTLLDYWKTWVPINREVTLFAARGDQALANELLRLGGQDPDTGAIAPNTLLASAGVEEIVETFASHLGARTPAHLYDNIARIFRDGGARTSVLIDGVGETLFALKRRGYTLGVATNDTHAGIESSLAQFDVLRAFDFLCGCDTGHGAKPLPGMALAFATAVDMPPSAIAVVGEDISKRAPAWHNARVGEMIGHDAIVIHNRRVTRRGN